MINRSLTFMLLMASVSAVHAATCQSGTWSGTLGKLPITLQLEATQRDDPLSGRYYYRDAMAELELKQDPANDRQWVEIDDKGQATGQLRLDCDGTMLTGEWRTPSGVKTLPIQAMRIPDEQYHAARLASIKPTTRGTTRIGNGSYERLVLDAAGASIQAVRLQGTSTGILAINQSLWQQATETLGEHLDCRAEARRERGRASEFESNLQEDVVAWSRGYVAVSLNNEGYCGGAHPWHGESFRTYRLDTGAQEDVTQWLREDLRQGIEKDSALGRQLMARYRKTPNGAEPECIDGITLSLSGVHPVAQGLAFQADAPYALTPCIEVVVLPIDVVLPFLTAEGRKALQTFR
ncbi:hypothetical protein [Roseateles amylovorans]|uniref:DUF3298 domain-containing protein n=1 Tax=Roseateles amylovorans TaxID=2978473 RepID=A0ABY6B3Q5_9BURK|nr:hypothetical protein [Roseateles amylovorans]UXH79360.1 hypothetical protein N4261_05360 [Roseateles amylovorans]